jgi:hypothetical protein
MIKFIDSKIEGNVLQTMVGNCFWAIVEIGIFDFIELLKEAKITMDDVMEYTVDDEFTPLQLEYYGFTMNDIVYFNPNQTTLF